MDPTRDSTEPTPVIAFTRSPAAVTIGEGLGLGAAYWRASWERWVLPAVAVALASGLAQVVLGGSLSDTQALSRAIAGGTIDPATVPSLVAGPLAVMIVSFVATWFLYANVIAGLRGRTMPLARIVIAGLGVVVTSLLVIFLMVTLIFVLLPVILSLGMLGVLLLLAMVPLLWYLILRLQFWAYALFDGETISGAVQRSWAISRGGVLRIFGWALVIGAASLLLAAAVEAAGQALPGVPAFGAAAYGLVTTVFSAFQLIVIGILYESQRLRAIEGTPTVPPALAQVPVGWGQPGVNPSPPRDAEPPRDADPDRDPDAPPPPPTAGPG